MKKGSLVEVVFIRIKIPIDIVFFFWYDGCMLENLVEGYV